MSRTARRRASRPRLRDANREISVGALLWIGSAVVVIAVVVGVVAIPFAFRSATAVSAGERQTLEVPAFAALSAPPRDSYSATPGAETYINGGTNRDWASLVLVSGGWPVTEDSVTVITRWMRQENYVKSWWNRNNPLNNGWGASGGFVGTNPSLRVAAANAAEALHTLPGYAGIKEAFAAGAPAATIEQAIWASTWASGHYGNGAHWSYSPVELTKAPAEAW